MGPRNPQREEPGSITACNAGPSSSSYAYDEDLLLFEDVFKKAELIEEKETHAKDAVERDRQRQSLKQLVAEYSDRLVKTVSASRGQNFLHFLASGHAKTTTSVGGTTVQKLVARMLLQHGGMDMLMAADDNNNTPMHTAIQVIDRNFLLAVSGPPSQPETIQKVRQTFKRGRDLWALHPTGTTFLHAALASRGLRNDNKLLLAMIALAPDAILRASDIKGRTPLHLAVENSKCTAGRFDIIQELISRNPSVLVNRDKKTLSVYQHFVASHNDSSNPNASIISHGSPDRQASSPASATPSVTSSINRGNPNVTEETSKRIRDLLLLESMRVMSCDVAHRCLHISTEPGMESILLSDLASKILFPLKSRFNMLDFRQGVMV